jgi:hypothetical protein
MQSGVYTITNIESWSSNRTGRKMPDWFGSSVSARRVGVKHTDEARAKMSSAKRAHPVRQAGHHPVKLNFERAEQIRREVAAGEMQIVVAKRHEVSVATVSQIVNGNAWKQAKKGS